MAVFTHVYVEKEVMRFVLHQEKCCFLENAEITGKSPIESSWVSSGVCDDSKRINKSDLKSPLKIFTDREDKNNMKKNKRRINYEKV